MVNIHFTNFSTDDFVSKGAKNNMKQFIKSKLSNSDEVTKEDLENLLNLNNELVSKYIKTDSENRASIKYNLEENDLKLTLSRINIQKENLKNKLHNKISSFRQGSGVTRKQFAKQEKILKQEMKQNSEVSDEMIDMFYNLRKSNPNTPSPLDILKDKDEYLKSAMQYYVFSQQSNQAMESDYINYIQCVCKFNIANFFKQMMMQQQQKQQQQEENPAVENTNNEETQKSGNESENIQASSSNLETSKEE